ncbi:MAG TPA: hypothetical protein VFE65_20115 [Pseudonocardia sp.]|jgi:hypothetical protein|nr:hypothetical protein [Pseudonocardia sp.]
MMRDSRFLTLGATGIVSLGACLFLSGCAATTPVPPAAKVTAAIEELGGTPETSLRQLVLYKSPKSDDFSDQIVFLVPAKNGRDYGIVDTQGETFANFRDFLENNELED